jgi:hypothetical protein
MVERVQLAQRVAVARARGDKWDAIAAAEGRPKRTLQALHKRYMAEDRRLGDPSTLVREFVDLHTEAMNAFADLAESGDNSSVRLGATTRMLDAAKARMDMFVALGLVPRSPTNAAALERAGAMGEELAAVLVKHDMPEAVIEELRAVVAKYKGAGKRLEPPRAAA